MVLGSPSMCIRHTGTPAPETTSAMRGSPRSADTSFTNVAPAAIAAAATSAFTVSIEIGRSVTARRPRITGRTRSSSTSAGTGSDPGRVDSPPTSRMSAPSAARRAPWATAAPGSRNSPPSENESGVTLITPITAGAGKRSRSGITPAAYRSVVGDGRRVGDVPLPAGLERPVADAGRVELRGGVVVEPDRVLGAELLQHPAPVPSVDAVAVLDAAGDDHPAVAVLGLDERRAPVLVLPLPAVRRHHRRVRPRRGVAGNALLDEPRLAAHDLGHFGPAGGVHADRDVVRALGDRRQVVRGEMAALSDHERLTGAEGHGGAG